MCLIIYSPNAELPTRADFFNASENNPDGIGVMSRDGIAKFLGKRKTRRAWRYVQQVAAEGIPFGVHFRWATHGRVSRTNCHPFEVPGHDAHLMHNGILWTSAFATEEESDTAVFAAEVAPKLLPLARENPKDYLALLGKEASGNRLLIMRDGGAAFDVVNPWLWHKVGTMLFSNTYSVDRMAKSSDYMLDWPPAATAPYTKSRAGWLAAPLARGWPSGPASSFEDDREDTSPGSWEEDIIADSWERDYEDALACGYTEDDAETYATKEAGKRVAELRGRQSARSGFDWHDRATWDKYPIPGTYADRVLNRHGDGEELDRPSAADMFI